MATHASDLKSRKKPAVTPGLPAIAAPAGVIQPQGPAALPNHAFTHIPITPQAKLTVSEPGDVHEMEAESVAEDVVRASDESVSSVQKREGHLSREPDSVQRSPEDSGEFGDVSGVVQDGLSGGGQPLDAQTRSYMEPRFGANFSDVRIHTDSHAAQSSEALSARAYTVGSDIAFKSGEYAPGSADGKRLLAHELTHVLQQGVTSQANRSLSRKVVQRYQAGDEGHGGIEKEGLTAAGFSASDSSETYFGNWLRDMSQLNPMLIPVINILALGEFGRPITPNDLGTYIPSEHLDNPLGGGTIEDPLVQAKEHSAKPEERAEFETALAKLSPDQRAAYDKEQTNRTAITSAAAASGLPEYIERGKMHAKDEFAAAVGKGDTPDGHLHLGNGLHAVEDYFSHSNFVEVAIWELYRSGAAVSHLVDRMANTTLGANSALVGGLDAKGEPNIVTGTYAPGGNDWVSRYELLKTEIHHGQFTKAFIRGLLKQRGIGLEEVAKRLGKRAGGAITGGPSGGIIAESAKGATAGEAAGSSYGIVGEVVGGLVGGLGGAVKGGIHDVRAGAGIAAEEAIEVSGGALDLLLAGTLATIAIALLEIGIILDVTKVNLIEDVILDEKAKSNTKLSQKEAPADPKTHVVGPTHSEIAKDAPDNALFGVSSQLAAEAVKGIGLEIKSLWASSPGPGPAAPPVGTPGAAPTPAPGAAQIPDPNNPGGGAGASGAPPTGSTVDPKPLQDLVDKYVSRPSADSWWQPIVLAAASKK